MFIPGEKIPLLVPINGEEDMYDLIKREIEELGIDSEDYQLVPLTDDVYVQTFNSLKNEGYVRDILSRHVWILSLEPDKDPTINIGEESHPKALRIVQVNEVQ